MDWKAIVDFVWEHYPISNFWEAKDLTNWLTWAASKDFLFLVYDSPEAYKKLLALALVRPMREVDNDTKFDIKHDMDGPILYCDLCLIPSREKKIRQAVMCAVVARFGYRQKAAFNRFGRVGGVKTHDFGKFRSVILGK